MGGGRGIGSELTVAEGDEGPEDEREGHAVVLEVPVVDEDGGGLGEHERDDDEATVRRVRGVEAVEGGEDGGDEEEEVAGDDGQSHE